VRRRVHTQEENAVLIWALESFLAVGDLNKKPAEIKA
jgi:hypothetical protein